jgi:hypothetical protein
LSQDDDTLNLSELLLAGHTTDESIKVKKEDVEIVSNPSPPWKAAFLVWKNSLIMSEIEDQEFRKRVKYKKKIVELLSHKYQIDIDILTQIVHELEEAEY